MWAVMTDQKLIELFVEIVNIYDMTGRQVCQTELISYHLQWANKKHINLDFLFYSHSRDFSLSKTNDGFLFDKKIYVL